ncbi:MAG: type II toxin-antitoxin system VapC family toxin [Dehalococcoidia bacterium]
MVSPSTERQYWDSCLWICYLQNKVEEHERVAAIRDLLRMAEAGRLHIVTSALAIAEVRPYAEQYSMDYSHVVEDLFATNRQYFSVVSVTRAVSMLARTVGEQNRQMSVADSIHVATALRSNVTGLFTLDGVRVQGMRRAGDLTSYDGKIGTPPLKISEPRVSMGPLFEPPEP